MVDKLISAPRWLGYGVGESEQEQNNFIERWECLGIERSKSQCININLKEYFNIFQVFLKVRFVPICTVKVEILKILEMHLWVLRN